MLADEIKTRMFQAMKAHRIVEKEILRVALGEIQTVGSRQQAALTDDEVMLILRKLIKSNEESIGVCEDPTTVQTLRAEIEILDQLLPRTLSVEEIVLALGSLKEPIRDAQSDGQAVGVAMKHLKGSGALVTGTAVATAVKQLRG